jgi:hypothetical protein
LSDIYASLLALQSALTPVTVTTLKRAYYNMMLKTLKVTTNKLTENVLSINCVFQEAIIVSVATTIVPASQLKVPGSNLGTQSVGNKSALAVLFGAGQTAPGAVP